MNGDQEVIKSFERQHARDRIHELARQIGHNASDDTDVFRAHTRSEESGGRVGTLLSLGAVALLIGSLFLFWS